MLLTSELYNDPDLVKRISDLGIEEQHILNTDICEVRLVLAILGQSGFSLKKRTSFSFSQSQGKAYFTLYLDPSKTINSAILKDKLLQFPDIFKDIEYKDEEPEKISFNCDSNIFLYLICKSLEKNKDVELMKSIAHKLKLDYNEHVIGSNKVEDQLVQIALDNENKSAGKCLFRPEEHNTTIFTLTCYDTSEAIKTIDGLNQKVPGIVSKFSFDSSKEDTQLTITVNDFLFIGPYLDLAREQAIKRSKTPYTLLPVTENWDNDGSDNEVEVEEEDETVQSDRKQQINIALLANNDNDDQYRRQMARAFGKKFPNLDIKIRYLTCDRFYDSSRFSDVKDVLETNLQDIDLVVIPGEWATPIETYNPDHPIMKYYAYILYHSIENNIPIYGECAGFERLAVFLNQTENKCLSKLQEDSKKTHGFASPGHKVQLVKGSILHKIVGQDSMPVDSSHNNIVVSDKFVLHPYWAKKGLKLQFNCSETQEGSNSRKICEGLEVTRDERTIIFCTQFHATKSGRLPFDQIKDSSVTKKVKPGSYDPSARILRYVVHEMALPHAISRQSGQASHPSSETRSIAGGSGYTDPHVSSGASASSASGGEEFANPSPERVDISKMSEEEQLRLAMRLSLKDNVSGASAGSGASTGHTP